VDIVRDLEQTVPNEILWHFDRVLLYQNV